MSVTDGVEEIELKLRHPPLDVDQVSVAELYTQLAAAVGTSTPKDQALAAILRLHRPQWQGGGDPPSWAPWQTPGPRTAVCEECGSGRDGVPWPCPTAQAVIDVIAR